MMYRLYLTGLSCHQEASLIFMVFTRIRQCRVPIVGLIHQSPWEFNLTDLSAGTYSFYVRARDNAGGRTDSDIITVTIYDDLPSSIKESYCQNSVSIYPNPASDFVRIVSNKEIGEISLFSIRGEFQMREYEKEKEIELNVSTLKPGLYFLIINNISHKLIVQ